MVKLMSYKAIFALVAIYNQEIKQINIKTMFLYRDINKDIQINLLTGYGVSGTAKLKKALYSLKQSLYVQYNTLTMFLTSLDFKPLNADSSVFCYNSIIITIYINDLLIISASKSAINQIKAALSKRFKMIDLSTCYFYLKMEVICDCLR